ncbi:zinc-binding dehydrogenase [Sinosporangium siamense]|uniref:NADPH:quinone reductase n=1 Tax=Sinosporangium siamense TaxID=1367973 RepID=A0A919VB80_9ACTN|nr:zinc-binding dehydrogenase [Sinosporangium siamense]GII97291.1 NADPH:quinone reductase [Sinosporangium siamense]
MRAIQVSEFGGPDVLIPVDIPAPVAGPGEMVLDLAVADVLFLDTLLRSGWGGEFFPLTPPYVPGTGGAGRVSAVGEGVAPAWIGRRVAADAPTGYAEQVVTAESDVVEIPGEVGFSEAAAVLHDGVTALILAGKGRIQKDEWVLVTAATGGAGSLLVQLALDAGARVVAAAGGERKLALARDLGAEVAVDYSREGWQHKVREATGGRGVDLVFDGVGGSLGETAFETVAHGGRFITYGSSNRRFAEIPSQHAKQRDAWVHNALEAAPPSPAERQALLKQALSLTAQGRLRPIIGATFPLGQARDAHVSLTERKTLGKSLLLISAE